MTSLADSPPLELAARLHALYRDASKHSVYQSVPGFVSRALGYQEEIHSLWRSDQPRYDYLLERLEVGAAARVADIGANTGYFSLNLAHDRPEMNIQAYEMNPRHAEFIRLTATTFGLDRLSVLSESCDLASLPRLPNVDVALLLNVLHHAGFDFDGHLADDNEAFTAYAIHYLRRLRGRAAKLVFQIGSNRGGDKKRPLCAWDDDVARLDWISRLLAESGWRPLHLGYAQLSPAGMVVFRDAPSAVLDAVRNGAVAGSAGWLANAALHRFPGEFHRRPLVIAAAD